MRYIKSLLLVISCCSLNAQIDIQSIIKSPAKILNICGNGATYAYNTKEKIYIKYDGVSKDYTQITYSLSGINYQVNIKDNIIQMAMNGDNRVYVSTKDNHILIFEEGIFLAGLPLEHSDLYTGTNKELYSNLKINDNWFAAKFNYNPKKFDDQLGLVSYPQVQSQINNMKPRQISVDNRSNYPILIGDDGNSIALAANTSIKVHKNPESYIPCTDIKDVTHAWILFPGLRNFSLQLYVVCGNGDIAYMTREIIVSNDLLKKFTKSDWRYIPTASNGWGKTQKIIHSGPNLLYAYTDANQNSIFMIDALKKTVCSIDLPGSGEIQDMYFWPSGNTYGTILCAVGDIVYSIETEGLRCNNGTSSLSKVDDINFEMYPNPSDGHFEISHESNSESIHIKIINCYGAEVYNNMVNGNTRKIQINTDLPQGIYVLQVSEKAGKTSFKKIVIN